MRGRQLLLLSNGAQEHSGKSVFDFVLRLLDWGGDLVGGNTGEDREHSGDKMIDRRLCG